MSPGPAAAGAPVEQPPVALYIHVPFCVSLCPYCDFVVYAGSASRGPRARVAAFVDALVTEIALRADALDAKFGPPAAGRGRPLLETVYLGGGTPTLLPAATIARLLDLVRTRLGIADGAEVTIESNPGADERNDARALAATGITRLSLGAQAFEEGLLRRLGRRHHVSDVRDAIAEARAAGFRSVSIDLLYDVPGQSLAEWSATLDAALELGPDHVSAYALTLDDPDAEGLTGPTGDHLPTRPGARRWREAAIPDQDDDRAAAQYTLTVERLAGAGYRGYEISNWARPDHESRHNLAYWHRRSYEAVGPGAHAFDGRTRRWNAARLDGYVRALTPDDRRDPALPPGGVEIVDAHVAAVEGLILGLRLDTGLALERRGRWAARASPRMGEGGGSARDRPVVTRAGIRLTTRGRLLSNELFLRLA